MRPKVLIVDDEEDIVQLIEFNLRQQGCETISASDGMQALRLARTEMPDVILLDVLLPDLDGLAVAEILHGQPSTRGIPIFMLSALSESFAAGRKRSCRFEAYFTKPVNMATLGESVRRAAKTRQETVLARLKERDV